MLTRTAIVAAAGASAALGAALSLATPTAMVEAPEPFWRKAAVAINAQAPYPYHPTVPEDLSPGVGYGNAAYYHRYYAAAPERAAYAAVPHYAGELPPPDPAASEPVADAQPLLDRDGAVQLALAAITPSDAARPAPDVSAETAPAARLAAGTVEGEGPL